MDPYAVLGVAPGASEQELTRAYRRLAKRHHPDRAPAGEAARMAEINAAYDMARAERERPAAVASPAPGRVGRPRRVAGAWLPQAMRRRLGRELLLALREGEGVELVTKAETWASPETVLVVTDRRLLWLLDDVVTGRVRSLRFDAIESVERTDGRRRAAVTLRGRNGRRHRFSGLTPETAAGIARHVEAACAAS